MAKAVTNVTQENVATLQKMPGVNLYSWAQFTGGADSGDPVQQSGKRGILQLVGTFGAAVVLEGSLDGTNYVTLKDVWGNAMSYTAAALVETQKLPAFVRVRDAGVTSVDAKLLTFID